MAQNREVTTGVLDPCHDLTTAPAAATTMFFRVSLADASPPVLMRVSVYALPNLTSWPSSAVSPRAGYDDKRATAHALGRKYTHTSNGATGQSQQCRRYCESKAMDAMVHNTHMV